MPGRVVIVGAGPVGLVTASLLVDSGIHVLLLDASPEVPRDLRASTFHPPTLDMLERFGVVDSMVAQGLICPTWQFRDRASGAAVATFELDQLRDVTRHPYRLQCEQWRLGLMLHERLRHNKLADIRLGWQVNIVRQNDAHAEVDATAPDGRTETLGGEFVIGADGINSIVRKAMGVNFDGITIPETFLTVSTPYDFRESMPDLANISYISDPQEWYVLIRTASLWRVLFPVEAGLSDAEVTSPDRIERLLQGAAPRPQPYEIRHKTAYRVHERVASGYVAGRLVIAGDAAHVNNPLGGMGLNGGIHDAFNLAGKLTEVLNGAPIERLEDYSRQRRGVALDVVQQTTLRNRQMLNTREPEAREAYYESLRATVADPDKHRAFLLRTSMIQSLRDTGAIT